MNHAMQAQQKYADAGGAMLDPWGELTVGDNIDHKIKVLQEEISRLEALKRSLSPLLSMRVRDIQQAMNL